MNDDEAFAAFMAGLRLGEAEEPSQGVTPEEHAAFVHVDPREILVYNAGFKDGYEFGYAHALEQVKAILAKANKGGPDNATS